MHLLPDAARDIVMIYEYFFNLYTRPLLLILDMMLHKCVQILVQVFIQDLYKCICFLKNTQNHREKT